MNNDNQAIETLVRHLGDAFNAKDAKAFAGLFKADAEFVTIFGMRMRGRADIEAGHARVFAHALAGNRMIVRGIEPKLLAADVALCHASWARERLPDAPEGSLPPGTGILTLVAVREGGRWAFAAATNVQDAPMPVKK